ncbi:MAG: DegT/DnrJ/EryC1/StrS family aminotransferase [Candidatus Binatia bacterium]
MTTIPLVDLRAQHGQVATEIAASFAAVIERTSSVMGEEVAAFERDYARFSGVAHCLAVASGSDALELPLRAAGIGSGDGVIVPVNSFGFLPVVAA